jgi:hypothetical protein|tara:strand:+ start:1033 stop:1524 length:492 start_codon:yes stop_codon:yes gene_type:complete
MQDLRSHYAREFARFYVNSFPNKPCKPVPSKLEDLNFTEKSVLMDWEGGVLYQNLFRKVDELPADVLERHLDGGRYNIGDEVALRAAGFTADAARIEGQILAAKNKIEEDKLAEMKARNDAREEEIRNKPVGFHPTKNISFWDPSAVAFRRQHGISDDIGAGL